MDSHKFEIKNTAAEQKRHWIRLTRICNQKCIFCHDRENQGGGVLSSSEILDDLKKGRDKQCTRVVLSGGEPTLHPKLPQIIEKAKSLGYDHVQIISNGRMFFYEDFARKLKMAGLDEVTLSLHSHLKRPFEQISQVKGSYHQAMKGLVNVLKNGFIVSVDIVINKINYKTLEDTLKFFIALGVSEFDLLHLIPFGDAWKNRKDIYYSIKRGKRYLNKAFELSKREHIYLWTNRLPAMYLEGYEELIQHPMKLEDEIKGRECELKKFIHDGQALSCVGERCQSCFLSLFCHDITELKTTGILWAKKTPPCLSESDKNILPYYRFRKNMNIYNFLEFFVKCRYFVKSLRCQNCKLNRKCDGAQIDVVRTRGFSILKVQ